MKIEKISIDIDDVVTLLTMEAGGYDYWGAIVYDENDYKKAKAEMKEKNIKPSYGDGYCYEEVVAYMITDTDYIVCCWDCEENERYPLTKEVLEKGFLLNAQNRPNDANIQEGDAITGDCILQYALFDDIIYG